MSFEARKRKSWREDSGVSEIVGNILILMITVVLFSSIMAFVNQIPIPEQQTKSTFEAKITFLADGTKANLTLTHVGGDPMDVAKTLILVDIGSTTKNYNLTSDSNFAGIAKWRMGMPWKQQLSDTSYTSKIQVTVVDMIKHNAVWTSQVTGGTGGSPPNIAQRWTDSDPMTATADPVKEYDDFVFYATINDPDGDLNESDIWIDSSQLETDRLPQAYHRSDYTKAPGSDVYAWAFTGLTDPNVRGLNASDLDGNLIIIHAGDKAGHKSISTFKMVITQLPVQDIPYDSTQYNPELGDWGLPSYLTWFDGDKGFGVYEEAINRSATPPIHLGAADVTRPNTTFMKESKIFVRFGSFAMTNVATKNVMYLIDTRTGLQITPNFTGSSSLAHPFYYYPSGGKVSMFEAQFDTVNLPKGLYSLVITLMNTPTSDKDKQDLFNVSQALLINQEGTTIQFIPELTVTMNPDYSGTWGTRDKPFEVSSVDKYKIYVLVRVNDATYPPSPGVAEIRIADMSGAAQVFGIPPAGMMMSKIMKFDYNHYNFSIDLRLSNGVQWKGGTNSYTLYITKLNDSNEGMYSLSKQIFVQGAGSKADFFVGTTGMASGNGNFNTRLYTYYIQNSNLFTTRVLWQSESTPGSSTDFTVTAMAAGDVDGDGFKDLLVAQAASNELYLFQNTLSTFGTWQAGSTISRPDGKTYRISWISFADFNGDGHDDFAYANSNGQIVLYETTYGSQGRIYTPPTGKGWTNPIWKIMLKDMTNDGRADLIVLAGGKVSVYDIKYFLNPSLAALRDANERVAVSSGTTVDFDVADVNNDGKPDIITADTTAGGAFGGSAGPNVALWTDKPFPSQTMKTVDLTYNSGLGYLLGPNCGSPDPGSPSSTQNPVGDGSYIRFRENGAGVNPTNVSATFRMNTLDNSPDQQLRMRVRIGATDGPLVENYYVWYSIDGSYFIPILSLTSTNWQWINYSLPASVAGKQIYVKFTDSSTLDSGTARSFVDIDVLGVFTNIFQGYAGQNVVADPTYTCVRAANIDGGQRTNAPYKEIVAAKNSVWAVYNWTASGWVTTGMNVPPANSTFYVSSASKVGTGYFNNLAPTLFSVRDVNGDGFTDIVVCNYTTTTTDNSYVGFYMNLYNGHSAYWRFFPMRQWNIDPPTGQAKDPWVDILISANLAV